MSNIRIGYSEREAALSALTEHVGAGRLTLDEFSDRSARVSAARTMTEIRAVFVDLPTPRPFPVARRSRRVRGVMTAAVVVGLGLYVLSHTWFALLLIPVAAVAFNRIWK